MYLKDEEKKTFFFFFFLQRLQRIHDIHMNVIKSLSHRLLQAAAVKKKITEIKKKRGMVVEDEDVEFPDILKRFKFR
jgi:hypothetical protein